ncbi:hypothetical protein EC991_002957 [Linnemannia zychae]|nr:hypothetical protein EC991_002957 [Linnemannia zychae]
MRSKFSASAPLVAGFLLLSKYTLADKVYLTMPQNNTNAIAGCDMDVGFRVQYSDLAMLQWVQLQVLSSDQTVVVDKLDNSTRAEWDDERNKNVTWSIPKDLAPGDYIVRAFGDAFYFCTEKGVRTLCPVHLEDRDTIIHVTAPLNVGNDPSSPSIQECPASLTPFSKPKTSSASSLSPPSLSSPLSSSSSSSPSPASASPVLHFNINPDVLNLLQNDNHIPTQQEQPKHHQQEPKAGEDTIGGDILSADPGKELSQKTETANGGMGSEKKDHSSSALNGAVVVGRVGSGMGLAVLTAVTLMLL